MNYTPSFILNKIDVDDNYRYIFAAKYWIAYHYKEMIPPLIRRITNKKEVGLKNTNDLIIWKRIDVGDLKYYGEGGIVSDDLFTVAGRANHLLKEITGQEGFGTVSMYSSRHDLVELQKKWVDWLLKL